MSRKSLLEKGLIGTNVKITFSQNRSAIGMSGAVIEETRNMIRIDTREGVKRLIKSQHTFDIEGFSIPGMDLVGKPEERIKKWLKKSKFTRTSESR